MTGVDNRGNAASNRPHRKRVSILLLYILVATPFIVSGAIRSLKTNANSPVDWVSDTFSAKAEYESFRKQFGSGDVVVMSWPNCSLENTSLDDLLRSLRSAPAFHDEFQQPWFERVTCGREVVAELTRAPTALSRKAAVARLLGTLVGQDGKQTCVIVTFNTAGLAKRSLIVPRLKRAVELFCQTTAADVHMAGPVMDGLAVDQASKSALDRFAPLSSLVVFGLCCVCLDSIPMATLVFGASILCQATALAVISWCGETMSALLIVMPPLIQVLAVAGGIHLANYYFEESRGRGPEGAAERAFQLGWLPCTLSSATTAIGLGSLLVSNLVPVRAFGAYAAAGVSLTLAVLLSVVPGVLLLLPARPPQGISSSSSGRDGWSVVMNWVANHHAWITAFSLLCMATAAMGTTYLKSSVRIDTLFGPNSLLVSDYRWLEANLGPLVPLEVVIAYDERCLLSFQDRLRVVGRIQQAIQSHPKISATTSALSFLPSLPDTSGLDHHLQQAALNGWLEAARASLVEARYLVADHSESYRVTGYSSALADVDFGLFLDEIRNQVEPLLSETSHRYDGVDVRFTGIMPLVHDIQRQLLEDLFASFVMAFVVIAIVMTLVQAGIVAGLLAMIPNVFPTLLLFGVLGWSNFAIDIGSVMTASVALGIAVDDTLHFLTSFRRKANAGGSRLEAALFACRHCGKAMLQTTLICGLGLLTFAFADFVPTARFAWMMGILLALAIVGDLIVLPALLIGPAGRLLVDPSRKLPAIANATSQPTISTCAQSE